MDDGTKPWLVGLLLSSMNVAWSIIDHGKNGTCGLKLGCCTKDLVGRKVNKMLCMFKFSLVNPCGLFKCLK